MVKKVISGFLVLATSTLFGMSLNQLNSASKTELMEINGIGEVKAAAIVKERRKGKFKSFEDFERVKGVGVAIAGNVQNDVKKKPAIKKKAKKKIEKKPAIKKKAKKKIEKKPAIKKKAKKKIEKKSAIKKKAKKKIEKKPAIKKKAKKSEKK